MESVPTRRMASESLIVSFVSAPAFRNVCMRGSVVSVVSMMKSDDAK